MELHDQAAPIVAIVVRAILMRTIMAGLAEFKRDLIRERVKSSLAAAQARGVVLGRQEGFRPSDKKAKKVLRLHGDGLSYGSRSCLRPELTHGLGLLGSARLLVCCSGIQYASCCH